MQKTILIVDCEQESSEELQQILQSESFLVLTAADGHQALSVYEAERPDLVLTEALLPKLNGFELCQKITKGELPEIRPVIMYSAIYKGEKYEKEAIGRCGAQEFLEKPIPKWQLLKAVRAALSGQKSSASVPQSAGVVTLVEPVSAQAVHETGDPLGVDALFDMPPSSAPPTAITSAPDVAVLETPLVESRPAVMPSIDGEEVDEALDAVRIDMADEAQQRDDLLAQQFEEDLNRSGQSILEFEAATANAPMTPADGQSGPGEFELDEVLPHIADSVGAAAEASTGATQMAGPDFALPPAASKNWLPVVILILLIVLAGVYFWFCG